MVLTPETVPLWGDTLCLDFTNSASWTQDDDLFDPTQMDVLRTPDMLTRWGRRLGLLDDGTLADTAELRRVRTLRGAIHRAFASISHGQDAAEPDIAVLMRDYAGAAKHAVLIPRSPAYQLGWSAHDMRAVRHAVAADAVRLLEDPGRLPRVSLCPGRDCGWLFLNVSGRRRWCSMSTCGSREKMRRLYQRQRQPAD